VLLNYPASTKSGSVSDSLRTIETPAESNFAGVIVRRLGPNSDLIDAATGQTFRSAEVQGLIIGFAAGFLSAGLRPDDRILVGCSLSPASTLAYFGAMYAGLVPILLESRALSDSGEALCRRTRAGAVWTEDEIRCDWARTMGVPHLQGCFDPANSLAPAARSEDDLAALMSTSGSTGVPRLVMVSHGNLIANTEAIARSQQLGTDERAMLILPISYCLGASVVHTHLHSGGGVVFDSRFMFPDKVLRAIDAYNCTTFAGVPTVYSILLERSSLCSIPLPRLRRFLQAGGPLAPESVRKMRDRVPTAQFYVMYGQTEATARISCLPPEHSIEKLGSAGVPLDNLTVRVVDDDGGELPKGETGEIWVKGPSVTRGYLDDPEETARKFCDGWLKTGDQASMDEDGYLWLKGRKGDFMKIRGVRVSFAEVEARVRAIRGVCECAATSVIHPEAGEAISLFVVPENGANDLPAQIRRTLPAKWVCSQVNLVAELPKTSNGKIARSRLVGDRMRVRTELEERINAILTNQPYALGADEHKSTLLALLKDELAYACERSELLRNYIAHWPKDYRRADRIADLPYLPVGIFKANPPLALVGPSEVARTLTSSATTGQTPSRVVLDNPTARRMTKGVSAIVRDFIGSARRPYLVVDTPETLNGRGELGARGAAVQGLRSFATEIVCCLRQGRAENLELDLEELLECAAKWKDADVLVYGFTYVIWNSFVQPLKSMGIQLNLPRVHVLHSGGWKRLERQAVTREVFAQGVASAFGSSCDRVIDFYGMVENVGVVYPDCERGNKHVPAFADVIVRNPLTLEPVAAGERGLVQVCSVLPTSFPGFLVLTDDIAEIIAYDGCACGRPGTCFRFVGRAPKAEVRGCGNVEIARGGRRL
jgi:acyl-CoA synthetase (AMP-forming)/AMP-acid ligase II